MRKSAILIVVLLAGCSAKPLVPGANLVMLSNEKPAEKCKYVGEVVGGQGNWWTDDITSSENIVTGSRNDLKNKAYQIGANYVHMQQVSKSESYVGGTTMGIVGHAYRCPQ